MALCSTTNGFDITCPHCKAQLDIDWHTNGGVPEPGDCKVVCCFCHKPIYFMCQVVYQVFEVAGKVFDNKH